ncbi:MAG TPA: TonB-dependent receptor [Blastocatellia bacterium]|nr:TonB-dependent receptor [Blastocatellia bacterium]
MKHRDSRIWRPAVQTLLTTALRASLSTFVCVVAFGVAALARQVSNGGQAASTTAQAVSSSGQSASTAAQGNSATDDSTDLAAKSLEELMDIKVVSASKREEKLFKTAAAVYVITQEDIRRSGMTRLPDLLRMVPGLDVGRVDGEGWAVSVRGFNRRFTSKLLVLVDGRSVYSHETSGVFWETLDMPLDLIDHIEVIRGPGGALWGANAVNGVINIITKRARDTQGVQITAAGGSEDRFSNVEYGGKIGSQTYYRAYGKYLNGTGLVDSTGRDTNDVMNSVHGGARVDWQVSGRDSLSIQGDIYDMSDRERLTWVSLLAPLAPPSNALSRLTGGDVLGRWDHTFSDISDMSFQFYYYRFGLDGSGQSQGVNTFDFDFEHHFAWGGRQDIVWGLEYRLTADRFNTGVDGPVQEVPDARNSQVLSAFFQDEFTLIRDRLRLTAGSKLEHDDYAGFNIQPDVRLLWTPASNQTVWAAVSKAVRTPSRGEESIIDNFSSSPGPGGLPVVATVFGTHDFTSEELLAYELGYRVEPAAKVSIDIASFYNVYNNLQTDILGAPFFDPTPVPRIVFPITFGNQMKGHTYGVETSVNWTATHFWKLTGSYSYLRMVLVNNSGNLLGDNAGDSPEHQFQVRSYLNLPGKFDLDAAAFYVSSLSHEAVPAYTRVDARLGWRVSEGIELSFGAQNLLAPRRIESLAADASVLPSEVKRTVSGKVTWRF